MPDEGWPWGAYFVQDAVSVFLGLVGLALCLTGGEPSGFWFASSVFTFLGIANLVLAAVQRRRTKQRA